MAAATVRLPPMLPAAAVLSVTAGIQYLYRRQRQPQACQQAPTQ